MSETNKVILAAVLGILVGFGGGRLLESRGAVVNNEEETSEVAAANESKADADLDKEISADTNKAEDASSESTATAEKALVTKQIESPSVSISVGDQTAGNQVLVSVKSDRVAWVAVHEDRDGKPGNILGARRVEHGTVTVEVMLLRGTVPENAYYVLLHTDDGDRMFDMKKDLPIIGADGSAVMASFFAK